MRALGDVLILAFLALVGPPLVFFCWLSVLQFFLWLFGVSHFTVTL